MNIGEFFRAATRPAVTVIFAATIAQVVVEQIPAPQWFVALSVSIVAFWFGERTIGHIKAKNQNEAKRLKAKRNL